MTENETPSRRFAIEVYPIGTFGNGHAIQHIAPRLPSLCSDRVKTWLAQKGVWYEWSGNYGYSDQVWVNVRPPTVAVSAHAESQLIDRMIVTVADDEAAWLAKLDFAQPGSAEDLRALGEAGL